MKKIFLVVQLFIAANIWAATPQPDRADSLPVFKTIRVGIFAPLYLDSVFSTTGNFRYKEGVPKFISPSVDFINGVQIALDSLKLEHVHVDAYIYDTKSYTTPLPALIKNKRIDTLDLLIGAVKDVEYKQLADFALTKNIPFISATYPNDGGVTANPFVVLMNATLKAHCEGIYSYLLQNHGTDKIFLCRKKGSQEDKVAAYFKALNGQEGKPLLPIQTINFDSTISPAYFKKQGIDSNRQTVIIGGSLDEDFAIKLSKACRSLYEKYPLTLIGMPNWYGFKDLMKKEVFEDFPVYFTTPYFNAKADEYSRMLMNGYETKLFTKPSDMAFKGFECVQLFTRLLAKHPHDIMSNLNDKGIKIYTEYNFKPVMLNKGNTIPDYFENKHLYFVRILNGTMYKAW